MRQRNVKNQDEILQKSKLYIPFEKLDMDKCVLNKNKLCLEIGIGKGEYIYTNAKNNPSNVYFGIELNKGVLSLAIKKIERNIETDNIQLNNLYLCDMNCDDIQHVFKQGQIDEIYLNFSDPWPKARHAKRRLTNIKYLKTYEILLKQMGKICIKTDNRKLFEYTLQSINEYKMKIENISLDLYKDIELNVEWVKNNIPTEYEKKFRDKGVIYALNTTYKRS